MRPATDQQLLMLTASHDHSAFAALYDRHAETVARYLWAWVEDRDAVQDLVQETFVTAWQKAPGVNVVEASALPWLLTMAKNHARNRQRKVARRRETPLTAWTTHPRDDSASADRERLRWVMDEIEALSEIDRRICELCLVQGWPYREAAAELGHSVSALAKRLQRARARIREAELTHD